MQICEKWNSLELYAWNLFINISVSFRFNHTAVPSPPTLFFNLPCALATLWSRCNSSHRAEHISFSNEINRTDGTDTEANPPDSLSLSLCISLSLCVPFGLPVTIKIAINSNYQRITSWKITFYYMIKVKLQLDDDNVHWNRFTCVVFPQQTANST